MENVSSAAWVAHDLGLAASIGGTIFGRTALMPALYKIKAPEERDFVSADAWRRFSRINLLSHAAFATTWLVGRTLLGGRRVSRRARPLVQAKDILVGASLITGVATVLLGNVLGRRGMQGRGPQAVKQGERLGLSEQTMENTRAIKHGVGMFGLLNMFSTIGVGALTALLARESNEHKFRATLSRC